MHMVHFNCTNTVGTVRTERNVVVITIDYRDRRSIYEQLIDRITVLASTGVLPPGSQLPSVRQLASELSINPNTIQRAYAELEKAGVTYTVKGKGSFITEDGDMLKARHKEELEADFRAATKKAMAGGVSSTRLVDIINEISREV